MRDSAGRGGGLDLVVLLERIAFHKLGRSVRIARADIAAYIEAGRVEPITASDVWRDLRQVG
jgi:hypothetical protein